MQGEKMQRMNNAMKRLDPRGDRGRGMRLNGLKPQLHVKKG